MIISTLTRSSRDIPSYTTLVEKVKFYTIEIWDIYLVFLDKLFTYMAFAKWVLFGAFQAIFVGLLSFYIIENVGMNEEGTTGGFWLSGCMTLAVVTISVNIKVILMCYSYHFLTVLSIIWSISIFYVTLVVLEQIESSNMFGIIAQYAYPF